MQTFKSKKPEKDGVFVSEIRLKNPTPRQLKAARDLVKLHKGEDFNESLS